MTGFKLIEGARRLLFYCDVSKKCLISHFEQPCTDTFKREPT